MLQENPPMDTESKIFRASKYAIRTVDFNSIRK